MLPKHYKNNKLTITFHKNSKASSTLKNLLDCEACWIKPHTGTPIEEDGVHSN